MNNGMTSEETGRAIKESLQAEHDELHRMVREFRTLAATGTPEVLIGSLDGIVAFCRSHFSHEETALRKHREMGLEKHVASHVRLLEGLFGLRAGAERRDGAFRSALGSWYANMTNHIEQHDRPALERLLVGQTREQAAERRWQNPGPPQG